MADLDATWGQDLSTTPSGDLALVDDIALTEQRIIRRLLTNPGDYLWHPEYGAGLPRYIGQAVPPSTIEMAVMAQILQEQTVARNPAPKVTAKIAPDQISLTINYWSATSGAPQLLEFDVS
jgi:phage baseplate assembly protein W